MRNLPKLTERLYFKTWMIEPSYFEVLHSLLSKAKMDLPMDIPIPEDDEEEEMMQVENGLAVINIKGVIGNNLGALEKMCMECCDVRDVKRNLDLASKIPDIEAILLCIDSPGGEVTYVDELANYIKEISKSKPVIAYCNDMMASAAYYIACAATEIWAHPASCAIGSIGVYCSYLDQSKAYEIEGLKLELFAAGKYKAQGMAGTSLSDSYKEILQAGVNDTYAKFTSFVKKCRPEVQDDTMQGLSYDAVTALNKGLVDAIVEDPIAEILK